MQTVRDGIRAFNAAGLAALTAGSSRPRSAAPVLDAVKRELCLAVSWRRAKRRLTSPDPAYARKNAAATG